jgi:hypothetical protein
VYSIGEVVGDKTCAHRSQLHWVCVGEDQGVSQVESRGWRLCTSRFNHVSEMSEIEPEIVVTDSRGWRMCKSKVNYINEISEIEPENC